MNIPDYKNLGYEKKLYESIFRVWCFISVLLFIVGPLIIYFKGNEFIYLLVETLCFVIWLFASIIFYNLLNNLFRYCKQKLNIAEEHMVFIKSKGIDLFFYEKVKKYSNLFDKLSKPLAFLNFKLVFKGVEYTLFVEEHYMNLILKD